MNKSNSTANMRVLKFSVWASLLVTPAYCLQREDAGVLDFAIRTSGHGVTKQVVLVGDALITSAESSCYIASRSLDSGDLLWRRNVCSNPQQSRSALASLSSHLYTMDPAGVVRAWTSSVGELLWDAQVPASETPGVWAVSVDSKEYVLAASEADLIILHADNGKEVDSLSALKALKLKSNETPQWLTIHVQDNFLQGVVAFVQPDGTTNRLWAVTIQIGNDEFTSVKSLATRSSVVASSFDTQLVQGSWYGLAVTQDHASAVTWSLDGRSSEEIAAGSWHFDWTQVTAIRRTQTPSIIAVQGMNREGKNAMGIFRSGDKGWGQLAQTIGGVVYCPEAQFTVGMGSDSLHAFDSSMTSLKMTGDMFVPDGDFIENLSALQCTDTRVTALMSTTGGTTTQIIFSIQGKTVNAKMGWAAEEGLATVSSAVVLDASHLGSDDLVEEQDAVLRRLSLSSRLASQVDGILSLMSSTEGEFSRRDHIFGFVKVAVLLSQTNHRLWGIKTSGNDRGSIRWSLDLPRTASWHTMVHGTTNSPNALHGINGGTHSREILVVSAMRDSVEWKCLDGTNGVIHAHETTSISSPIAQVIPVYGSIGACRQASLLLHDDRSISVIPGDAETTAFVQKQLAQAPNGMYTHIIDKVASKLDSFQIVTSDSSLVARQVGRTSFAGERVVKVTYPMRDEMIQTMSTILGDNSLLLKYINPHLAVIITVTKSSTKTSLAASIEKSQGTSPKRKPAGVGDAATITETQEESVSNLFVNLVDTVSGRVVHRASHANADVDRDVTALISENWIIYSFVNAKTRRTEVGVLTLHEGMIDSKGIGLFKAPEQTTSFSSFDPRESKPVVLAKTYTYPKFITALGVTETRGGISSRNILIASDDGKITSLGRVMLETRRPLGEVKDAEKKEGLFPYTEMIPQVPVSVISYNHTVEAVTSVISAPTALESQSLILAFGGPDIFVTRTSPSKGFDLLPDSFSRILVSIVSIGLVIVLFVVQRMGSQKALKQGWL